ncbi:MAG TPA: hypothetical protein VGL81_06625 [Polyangiaceae bacterium]
MRAFLWARLGPMQLPREFKEDFVGDVMVALWQRRTDADPASTIHRMVGLARTILEGKLVDYWRHQEILDERTVDAPRTYAEDAPDADEAEGQPTYVEELRPLRSLMPDDALDAKQQMEHLNEVATEIGFTDDDVEDLYAVTWDSNATYEELAEERGMTPGALRTRLHRLSKAASESWDRKVKRRLILPLLLLAMLLLYVLAAIGPARKPPPPPAPLPEPTVHQVAPVTPAPTVTTTPRSAPMDDGAGRKPHMR